MAAQIQDHLSLGRDIEALEVADELRALLVKSRTSQKNGTKNAEVAIQFCRQENGVDLVQFHALTLVYATFLGGSRKMMAAREHALLVLRPDLFFRSGIYASREAVPSQFRHMLDPLKQRRAIKARKAMIVKLKGLIEKPAHNLRPILKKVEDGWVAALK